MSFRLRLLRTSDYVLVHLDEMSPQIGSIIVPEAAQTVPIEGVVLATGGRVSTVEQGDRVGIGWQTGTPLDVNGRSCVLAHEGDLLYVRDTASSPNAPTAYA